jgi:hypothetical protein
MNVKILCFTREDTRLSTLWCVLLMCAHLFFPTCSPPATGRCYKHTREPNANAKDLLDRLTT